MLMKANQKILKKLGENEHGYAAAIGGVAAVLITVLISILIYWKIAGSMGIPSGGSTAATAVNNTATSVFTLAPIIGIVMIAGIILAIVTRFGQGTP